MPASKEALSALLERVESASGPNLATEMSMAIVLGTAPPDYLFIEEAQSWQRYVPSRDDILIWTPPPYTASVDAALALVAEKLPGWSVSVDINRGNVGNFARVYNDGLVDEPSYVAHRNQPAPLLILSALLRALMAQAQTQTDTEREEV